MVRDSVRRHPMVASGAAMDDALTGLLNRRGLEERLGAEVSRAHRDGRPLAVVLFDDLAAWAATAAHRRPLARG